MIKYWIKNRFLYSLISILVLGVLTLFAFNKTYLETESYNLLVTSVYEKSEIDFDIPSPTKEQLLEIKNLDYIDDAFGYYYTESSIKVDKKNIKAKILFSDMMDSIDFTMYCSSRLISSEEGLDNPIYIDYDFSKRNNVNLGDEMIFNNIKFQVGRIYETNTYYGSAIFAPLVGEQKNLIESTAKSYSGAYLKSNDISKTDNYLKTYKPLGRLKLPSDFASDEEYQMHYNYWKNASYYNEITSFASKAAGINKKSSIGYVLGIIISGFVMVALFVILSFRKCEKSYFRKKKEKKDIKKYYICASITDAVLLSLVLIGSSLLAQNFITTYIPKSILSPMIISSFVCGLIVLIIELIYSIIYSKKMNE